MKILSVSTATNHLSVALNDGQQIIVEKNERDERNHSEHLDPLIDEILKERRKNWKPRKPKYEKGVLRLFSQHAASTMKGAYLEY